MKKNSYHTETQRHKEINYGNKKNNLTQRHGDTEKKG